MEGREPLSADRPEESLHKRLLTIIDRGAGASLGADEFEQTALEIFALQFEMNPIYRAYSVARGATPATVSKSLEIPAVPTDAFKSAALVCGDERDAAVLFKTSGTTGGEERRGTHYLLTTNLYKAALRAGFRLHLMPDREKMRFASLVPAPGDAPESSLSFMIGDVIEQFGTPDSVFFASPAGLDTRGFLKASEKAAAADETMIVTGTSFAFVHLIDEMTEMKAWVSLPAGSRVMDTGGFKGKTRDVQRGELYRMIEESLGIGPEYIVNEFGMTEMSSQLYAGSAGSAPGAGEPRVHTPPPWLSTNAVDPETLQPLPDGAVGILRHLDMANMYSVMALQTADLGRVTADGVEILGRASGAETRGCSVAMDELLQVLRRRS